MIGVVDCGMGNPGSILNMVRKAGGDAVITSDAEVIQQADALVLPGVGAFDNGMRKLQQSGLIGPLTERVLTDKVPLLAVCIGMHLLFERSKEGQLPGLGWVEGEVVKFDTSVPTGKAPLKVPHMGWNLVSPARQNLLFKGLEDEARFYFVHSYHVQCRNPDNVLATSDYGGEFHCAINRENIYGTQFHPEKSHRFGLTLFRNFLELSSC